MAPGNYRPDGSPIIGISPHRLTGQGGITNTLDLGGGQKIQDYLAGAGVSNQGPGGSTLYTAGGGTAAGGGTIPIPGYNRRDPNFMQNQISVHNIDDQGNITGQTGLSRVVAKYGNIKDLNSFSPELQAAIQGYQSRPEGGGIFGGTLGSGDANLGFGSVENPLGPAGPGVGGMIPAAPVGGPAIDFSAPGYTLKNQLSGNDFNNPFASTGQEFVFQKMFEDAGINPGGQQPKLYSEDMSGGIDAVADPITNNFMPLTPQQQTGGFDSKVFANELLTGIGDLFKQHFPDSAQMAFNNSNQPQSQIEQPIQDATTFDVQPQQNTAYNPFSVNTIGGAFGGGY